MIAANSLRVEGAGFGGNTNVVTVITKEKEVSLGKNDKRGDSRRTFDDDCRSQKSLIRNRQKANVLYPERER